MLFSPPQGLHPGLHDRARPRRQLKPEFDKRNIKVIGLSASTRSTRTSDWAKDIEETPGHGANFPLIADPDHKVADLYGMIHPNASDTHDRALRLRRSAPTRRSS